MKSKSSIRCFEYLWNFFVEELRKEYGSSLLFRSQRLSTGTGRKSIWEVWVKKEGGTRTTFVINSCTVFIHADKLIDYNQWREALETYCLAGRKAVIQGEPLKLGAHLGFIRAVTVERNHTRKKVNFNATRQQPKVLRDGRWVPERRIYYTDDFYPLIQHIRKGMLKNQKNYRFVVAKGNRGGRGFAGELFMSIKLNPSLLDVYPKKLLS